MTYNAVLPSKGGRGMLPPFSEQFSFDAISQCFDLCILMSFSPLYPTAWGKHSYMYTVHVMYTHSVGSECIGRHQVLVGPGEASILTVE